MRQPHHLKTFIFKKLWQQWWGEFFLNGVHNSKQSRAPCTKGTKNLKIQRIRKQQKYTEIEIQNTSIWKYKHIKTIYENTLNINVTAPTWEGDLNCSIWGPDFE